MSQADTRWERGRWSCGWPAPAKLNLFLHITGQRTGGYHELQTLFQFLDHGDSLAFRARADGAVQRFGGLDSVAPEDDLAVRAARALQATAGIATGADIWITKQIPAGSGLGGGSSDAATTLVALNRLWGAGLSPMELADIGLGLGADVPVFVHGRAAWAEGVGEELDPVEPREPWYLVIVPPVAVSTGALFAAPELTRDCPPMTMRDFLARGGSNVFELPVRSRYPEVAEAFDWLSAQGVTPRLTGTGASVFGAWGSESEARRARERLPAGWYGFAARGSNRSRLATRMTALAEQER
jgi:4-diphosphocytidyl-2-C-methyl-D-erythritol kinase